MPMLAERLIATPLLVLFLMTAGNLIARPVGLDGLAKLASANRRSTLAEAVLDRIVLGCGLLVAVLFAAASTGLYRPPVLQVLALATVVIGGLQIVRKRPWLPHATDTDTPVGSWLLWVGAVPLVILLLVLWLQSIRPDLSWDANVYHLALPKLFLEHGGFYSVPLNVYSQWPLATELLYGLAMAVHDYVLAKQLHFVFGILVLLSLLVACASPGSGPRRKPTLSWTGLLAIGLFLANPVVLYELRIAYVDLALAFFFFAAFRNAERLLQQGTKPCHDLDRRPLLLLLGTASGLVCAVKLSGVLAAASILLVYWAASVRSFGPRRSLKEAPWILVPLLVLAAPWPLKSWWLTNNPAYPLFYRTFGGPDWSSTLSAQHAAWQSTIGMGRHFIDYLLLPVRIVTQGGPGYDHFDGRLHQAWLLFVPLSAWAARKDATQRRVLAITAFYFAAWAATSQQLRLLIPLLALLSYSGARALVGKAKSTSRFRARVVTVAALAMIAVSFKAATPYLRQTPRLARDLAALGYQAQDAVIQPIYRIVDNLPPTSRILLLNTNHGFFLNRPYIADSFFEASQIQDLFGRVDTSEQAEQLLRQRRITHILRRNRQPGLPYPAALIALLQNTSRAQLIYRSPDDRYDLFRLQDQP